MDENCIIPTPINFNCWKHHAGFIKKQIESIHQKSDLEKLRSYLLKIGESQMDLYCGRHSPGEIAEKIIQQLKKKNILSEKSYHHWLVEKGDDYQLMTLDDRSVWTLRKGKEESRYVHIHPGRYSPHTRRVKALTLKTAIFYLCYERIGDAVLPELDLINKIRIEYLNEPPLKTISVESGLGKLLNQFRSK